MATELKYNGALLANTAISIFFILLLFAASFNLQEVNGPAITAVVLILVPFAVNLLFNRMLYSLIKANKESRLMPEWIISYRNFILILKIISVLIIALFFFTGTFLFLSEVQAVTVAQQVIYTVFLSLTLVTLVTDVIIMFYYQKIKKQNKAAINNIIESIGGRD